MCTFLEWAPCLLQWRRFHILPHVDEHRVLSLYNARMTFSFYRYPWIKNEKKNSFSIKKKSLIDANC
jgi:hypothetical protein